MVEERTIADKKSKERILTMKRQRKKEKLSTADKISLGIFLIELIKLVRELFHK
ncbi:hypothetical protein STRDD13_00225 [Streptococcus sp. DD13]|nr:hypothetical protein STRDD13_00225 [Streptococcus sp. DD13]